MSDEQRWRLSGALCVYCGEGANTVDHWPPRSFGDYGLLLPACRECNLLAGVKYPTSLRERITEVKYALRRKYIKYMSIPEWSDDELCRMGKTLRSSIVTGLETKRRISRRIAWNAAAYLLSIDSSSVFAQLVAECEQRMLSAKRSWTRTDAKSEWDATSNI